jgi:hypothetical protein
MADTGNQTLRQIAFIYKAASDTTRPLQLGNEHPFSLNFRGGCAVQNLERLG